MPRKLEIDLDLIRRCESKMLTELEVDGRNMRPLVRLGYVSFKMTKLGVRTYRASAKGRKLLAKKAA